MALRAGYQGFKKLLPGLKLFRPGCLGIDNDALAEVFYPRSEQTVTGATNLLENKFTSATVAGIATTKDDDGVMTLADGTTTGNYYAIIQGGYVSSHIAIPSWLKKGETYYISDGQGKSDMWVGIWLYDSSDQPLFSDAKRNEAFTVPDTAAYYLIALYTSTGKTITDGTKFYPMISVGDTKPSVFAPFAMTNKDLTAISQPTNDIIKVGRLAVVNKKIILTEPLTTSWNNAHPDFADFPSPVQNTTAVCYSGGNWFSILFSEGINVVSNSAIASGSTVYVTCTYITKS